MYKVNGVAMPTPKIFRVQISDIDGESNRNANGELYRDRITTKCKIELEYPPLTQEQISLILNAIYPVFVQVTFLHPMLGNVTKEMYAGDKSAPVQRVIDGIVKWEGLTFNFIER